MATVGGRRWAVGGLTAGTMLLAVLASGCRYGTAGSLPPELKTIAVTLLRNQTDRPGLEGEVTAAVTSAIQSQGRLAVVSAGNNPDLVLTGCLDEYKLKSVRTDRYGDPVTFAVVIEATVWVRRADGEYLLRKVKIDSQSVNPAKGGVDLTRGESEVPGRARAVNELGLNIARRIIDQGW